MLLRFFYSFFLVILLSSSAFAWSTKYIYNYNIIASCSPTSTLSSTSLAAALLSKTSVISSESFVELRTTDNNYYVFPLETERGKQMLDMIKFADRENKSIQVLTTGLAVRFYYLFGTQCRWGQKYPLTGIKLYR